MKLALSNKKEGTELFQGGNYKHAAARYNKALTHACKFFDVSLAAAGGGRRDEAGAHLNIAQCWLKIQEGAWVEQVVRSCKARSRSTYDARQGALPPRDGARVEGRLRAWRRPTSRQPIAPDDKAVAKLGARVDAQIKRQEQKEKKMYSKMFA